MNVGDCVLNASLPLRLHTSSIKRVFYSCSTTSLFEEGFILRCFQNLSRNAWLPGAIPFRITGKLAASKTSSSRTMASFPSDIKHFQ